MAISFVNFEDMNDGNKKLAMWNVCMDKQQKFGKQLWIDHGPVSKYPTTPTTSIVALVIASMEGAKAPKV
ncbi:unnamed protein product [Ambrosiozyma monospora]|uniref:Unnamed protein product n=1 Tax=Ambrosiozyma monospora TaxID=43982 RepID=A0ACB5SZJ3_AMBMO|nr:unnamed protein product [Ambrosiozyma monospora]